MEYASVIDQELGAIKEYNVCRTNVDCKKGYHDKGREKQNQKHKENTIDGLTRNANRVGET